MTVISLLSIELFLRTYFGFCDAVLMKADSNYEYIALPNQDRFRFRNHIHYNSFSMRSNEVDTNALIILGFGDSVINGGVQTDQDSLATTIISDSLSKLHNRKVQVLNISAGSWGPDNCFSYLKKHGNFNSKSIILFVSSHDAYDNMTFQPIIDVNESFPSKQYTLALWEISDRYIIPKVKNLFFHESKEEDVLGISKKEEKSSFNSGFASFLSYSKENQTSLTIYLHADKNELKEGTYNQQGKEILELAVKNRINLITDLNNGLEHSDFRDDIHINTKGQRKLAHLVLSKWEF